MNKIGIALALVASLLLNACGFNNNNRNISLRTSDSKNELTFTAKYPDRKTKKVQDYIEKFCEKDQLFEAATDAKKTAIKLADGTQFELSHKPGYLSIDFDRDKNSAASYDKMKEMIAGFGNAL